MPLEQAHQFGESLLKVLYRSVSPTRRDDDESSGDDVKDGRIVMMMVRLISGEIPKKRAQE